MHPGCVLDWDELATIWSVFEGRGLTTTHLDALAEEIRPPVGVLGAGRGLLVGCLSRRFGVAAVEGYEGSDEMLRQAAAAGRREIRRSTLNDPIPATRPLQTLIVATGVLDPFENDEIAVLLERAARVLRPNGRLLLAFFRVDSPLGRHSAALGADHALGARWPLLLRHAMAGDERLVGVRAMIRRVASARACGEPEAAAWLERVLPRVRRLFEPDDLVPLLRRVGLTDLEVRDDLDPDVSILIASRVETARR